MARAALWRNTFLDAQIYPVFFMWRSGFFETIADVLAEQRSRGARDEMDDWLEQTGRAPSNPFGMK
jgi:hypothetical protein